jgi:anti-sigma regulatory factor (Ser/Thr protein kinase)
MDDVRYWSYVGNRVEEAAEVRGAVRRFLETQADRDRSDLDAAEQIVGELMANAVRHGAPPFGICIDWDDDPPTLCIVDRGPGMPPLYAVPEAQSEHGRGLLLVRALAGEVLVDSPAGGRGGTRVVATLPVCRSDAHHAA